MTFVSPKTGFAQGLHKDAVVIDLHADMLIPMRAVGYQPRLHHRNAFWQKMGFYHCDIPRFRQAGMTGQFFGLVTFPYPERGCADACLRQAGMLKEMCRQNSIPFVRTAEEIRQAKRENRMVALAGIEGGHNLEGRLEYVRQFHEAGVRYIGLAHFTRNELCPPCGGIGSNPKADLTDFGRAVVKEMNRLGMLVDLAHVARRAFLQAAKLSTKPVIVSHTGIHGAFPLWRNLDDEQIRSVAEKDGVMGIIYAWRYLGRRRRGVEMLAPHFEHVRNLVGARHLALGSDYDGAVEPVRGLEDVSAIPAITKLLVDMGWKEDEVRGVLGENVLRVLEASPPS